MNMNVRVVMVQVTVKVFLFFLVTIYGFGTCQTLINENDIGDQDETAVISSVDAVLARSATLPCDIEPTVKEDRVYMVLWYRDGHSKPIYSFDVRGRSFNNAKQWSDQNVFGARAYFVAISQPAVLTLDGVSLDDAGIYRCRVDFKTSPTRNFAMNLTVIVPPHQLLLYDKMGRDVKDTVGPLEENSDLVLTCEVRGGSPTPTVSWFINDRLEGGHLEVTTTNNVIVNRLEVKGLTRDRWNSTFKCQASNTKLVMPVEQTVRLDMLMRPLSVFIRQKPKELTGNKQVTIQCEVYGSRPKAVVTWMRENRLFRRGKILEENSTINDSLVMNSLTFTPVPEDDGSMLKCVGENPKLTSSGQEDSFMLNVVYPPQVVLNLGSTLNPDGIKEGDDVYFECNIKANPKQQKITWYHNGVLVSQNVSSGVIISTHSLVLQSVTRGHTGNYTCLAVNALGETMSPRVELKVRYAPVCKENDVQMIGASLDEVLNVQCRVDADPANVTFLWQFNNSGESFDAQPPRFATSSGNVSEFTYIPKSQKDYGTLTCWGANSIGRQAEPCIFQVVLASKPSPLSNCTLKSVNNQTIEIVDVECKAGYDGGLPQKFVLEAFDAHTMRLRINQTVSNTEFPTFHLDLGDLLPSPPSLKIIVYSVNGKGKSEMLVLDDIKLNDAEKRTDGISNISIVPLAALLTGSLLTLGIAVLVIVVIAVRKKRHCDSANHCSHHIALDATKTNPKSQRHNSSSMLEINTGDNRYVVAYTLKPAENCAYPQEETPRQPDILNTPRGEGSDDNTIGTAQQRPKPSPKDSFQTGGTTLELSSKSFPILSHSQSNNNYCDTSGTLGRARNRPRQDVSFGSFATMRREQHILTDNIPGPESCV